MSEHLGCGHGESKPEGPKANQRNGTTGKTVIIVAGIERSSSRYHLRFELCAVPSAATM